MRYGLKNLYYSKLSVTTAGPSYDTPVAIPGAVALDMSPEGDTYIKYADNIQYFVKAVNNGYSGTVEVADLPATFFTDILGETVAAGNGITYETSDGTASQFALLFQFEGDVAAQRHVLYNCTAQRPNITGNTTEEQIEIQDDTLNITVSPLPYNSENIVKAKCKYGDAAYSSWFSSVTLPAATT